MTKYLNTRKYIFKWYDYERVNNQVSRSKEKKKGKRYYWIIFKKFSWSSATLGSTKEKQRMLMQIAQNFPGGADKSATNDNGSRENCSMTAMTACVITALLISSFAAT